ncbi:uncharacterized protein LOC129942449 [Eupeodes corollae]|uniref:uncharacterized protein LOC129942449 n=1 Tax=Eupeodes corollae TaxID=290404 RepID=UPI0024903326|nr:uncharacterized protein LOC129942449 [Eupeodes corollae]XP_055907353.1 uncharacterized protein LOC129942449 [Eupeodes corollae]XP_055907354.1 uncharacterized protein LOC129942449 [Eupeodes corollae]
MEVFVDQAISACQQCEHNVIRPEYQPGPGDHCNCDAAATAAAEADTAWKRINWKRHKNAPTNCPYDVPRVDAQMVASRQPSYSENIGLEFVNPNDYFTLQIKAKLRSRYAVQLVRRYLRISSMIRRCVSSF